MGKADVTGDERTETAIFVSRKASSIGKFLVPDVWDPNAFLDQS